MLADLRKLLVGFLVQLELVKFDSVGHRIAAHFDIGLREGGHILIVTGLLQFDLVADLLHLYFDGLLVSQREIVILINLLPIFFIGGTRL